MEDMFSDIIDSHLSEQKKTSSNQPGQANKTSLESNKASKQKSNISQVESNQNKNDGVSGLDYARLFGAGAVDSTAGLGNFALNRMTDGLVDEIEQKATGKSLTQKIGDYSESIRDGMSDEMKASMNKKFIDDDFNIGDAWTDPNAVAGNVVGSLPSILLSLAPGAIAARTAAQGALKAGATQEAAKQAAMKAGAITGGISEGAQGGLMAGADIERQVMTMPEEILLQNPEYAQAIQNGISPEIARAQSAKASADLAATATGAVTGATGAWFGKYLGKLVSKGGSGRLQEAGRGAINEGITETVQSGAEQFLGNLSIKEHANPNQSLSENVANAGATGLVAGGITGGAIGAGLGGNTKEDSIDQAKEKDNAQTNTTKNKDEVKSENEDDLAQDIEFYNVSDDGAENTNSPQRAYYDLHKLKQEQGQLKLAIKNGNHSNEIKQKLKSIEGQVSHIKKGITDYHEYGNKINHNEEIKEIKETLHEGSIVTHPEYGDVKVTDVGRKLVSVSSVDGERDLGTIPYESLITFGKSSDQTKKDITDLKQDNQQENPQNKKSQINKSVSGEQPLSSNDIDSANLKLTSKGMPFKTKRQAERSRDNALKSTKKSYEVVEYLDGFALKPVDKKSGIANEKLQSIQPGTTEQRTDDRNALSGQSRSTGTDVSNLSQQQRPEIKSPGSDNSTVSSDNALKIEQQANQAATSPANDLPEPSQKQKEAGNYKKGHVKLQGLDIAIENPQGSSRSGTDENGKSWSVKMAHHYGYVKGTEGADKDQVDIYIGNKPDSNRVFVVNQNNPNTGKFDEHKVMIGFDSEQSAKDGYLASYEKGWKGLGDIVELSMDEFKTKLSKNQFKKAIKNEPKSKGEQVQIPQSNQESDTQKSTPKNKQQKTNSQVKDEQQKENKATKKNQTAQTGSKKRKIKFKEITQQEWDKTHDDYKSIDEHGQKSMLFNENGGTVSRPVKILDKKPKPKSTRSKPTQNKERVEPNKIGVNKDGFEIYEDENGVRSYLESGFLINEPVSINLSQQGVNAVVENRKDDFLTESELKSKYPDQPATPDVDQSEPKEPDYGKTNKIFTEDSANKARELLKKKLGQLNTGIDPEILQAGLTLAGYHIEAGAKKFGAYSRAMTNDLGDAVKPYLRSFYESVRHYPGFDSHGMTTPEETDLMQRHDVHEGDTYDVRGKQVTVSFINNNNVTFKDGSSVSLNEFVNFSQKSSVKKVTENSLNEAEIDSNKSESIHVSQDAPLKVTKKLTSILDKVLKDVNVDNSHDDITINFSDPDYSETGGYHPVEISIQKNGKINYITDYTFFYDDMVKDLDFDFQQNVFEMLGSGRPSVSQIRQGAGLFKAWQANFTSYFSMGVYDVEVKTDKGEFTYSDNKSSSKATAEKESEQKDKPSPGTDNLGDSNKGKLATAFYEKLIVPDVSFSSITQARKYAETIINEPIKPGTEQAKLVDEAIELGVVLAARDIVSSQDNKSQVFDDLLDLYNRMPTLSVRTSESMVQQAYSTPVPLSYLASELAGVNKDSTVYEPSAGHGALVLAANPDKVTANELNEGRSQSLKSFGFNVSTKNAAEYKPNNTFDIVLTNPPFGVVKDENIKSIIFSPDSDNPAYKTREIDHAISLKALETLKDNGRAVLILGGVSKLKQGESRANAYNAKAKREFYFTLYNKFNVVDHFTVSGDLYKKQGAAWPVDFVVIHGKGKSKLDLPAVNPPRELNNFEQLKEVLNENATNAEDSVSSSLQGFNEAVAGGRVTTANTQQDGNTGRGVLSKPDGGQDSLSNQRRRRVGDGGGNEGNKPLVSSSDTENGQSVGDDDGFNAISGNQAADTGTDTAENTVAGQSEDDSGGSRDSGRNESLGLGGEADRPVNTGQAKYKPKSQSNSMDVLTPVNMQQSVEGALNNIEFQSGPIDKFVADNLEYPLKDIGNYFSAEQIDAIALALKAFQSESAFIIGDQTGMGKGRVVASMIKYAMINGKTPIFVTEKPNLYGDIYRDLVDIGVKDINPIMTDSGKDLFLDEDETVRLKTVAKKHKTLLSKIALESDLGEYNMVFTTYSQMQTVNGNKTVRHDFLESLNSNAMIIFDESHNAGGSVQDADKFDRAKFARQLANNAWNVLFSSATYAKRPSVMDLYFRTDM